MRHGRRSGDKTGGSEPHLMSYRGDGLKRLAVASCAVVIISLAGGCANQAPTAASAATVAAISPAPSSSPSPASLPQTAFSSGLRITLSSGSRSGDQIVLTFKIESADPHHPNLWELSGGAELMGILAPERDIVATGLRWNEANQAGSRIVPQAPPGYKFQSPAPAPTPQPTPDIASYLESIPFVLTGSAD